MTAQPSVIARKHVNALFPDAVPSVMARTVPAGILKFFKRYGYIWLAGTATLTPQALSFAPNRFNRALYDNVGDVVLPLARVADVAERFGVLASIVDVRLDDGSVFSFRCFGAKPFARSIASAVARAAGEDLRRAALRHASRT
jgi:hypothetical protein